MGLNRLMPLIRNRRSRLRRERSAVSAPGFVAGLTQINFQIPDSIFHGISPLQIALSNSFSSQAGVYFYLR
jgi:uncharacterized protein (TIGR03437 family)